MMPETDGARHDARSSRDREPADERALRIEQKMKELAVFRDAGLLTEVELEEQKARLRWDVA